MNEQLQQALAQILAKTIDAAQAGVSFLQAEIPDVVRQLLLWKMVSYTLTGIAASIAIALWFYVGTKVARKVSVASDGVIWIPYVLGTAAALIAGVPFAFTRFLYAVQIAIAPKIYLIEYAASLVSGK